MESTYWHSEREFKRKVLAEVKVTIQDIWENLDEDQRLQVKLSITKTLEDVSELEKKFKRNPSILIDDAISHLEPHRRQLIKTSFDIQTYQAIINNENNTVSFYKDGQMVLPSITLDSVENFKRAILLVGVSIIVETVIFFLNLAGFTILTGSSRKATENLANKLARSELFRNILMNMSNAAKSGDYASLSRHMLALIVALKKEGMFWDIVRDLLSSMGWVEYALAAANIAAFVLLCIGSGGAAVLASLVTRLAAATGYINKFFDLSALSNEFKSNL